MATQQQTGAYGALGGAVLGGVAGSFVGMPGMGASLGSSLGGSLGGAMGSSPNAGFDKNRLNDIFTDRDRQIGAFSNSLAQARQQYYQTTLPNYQKYAMSRFMPQIESNLAGRGLQMSGGAFGSALARQSADFQAQQSLGQYQDTRNDLNSVNNAYAQNYGGLMGATSQNLGAPAQNNNLQDLTTGAGQLGSALLNKYLQNPQQNPGQQNPNGAGVVSPNSQWTYSPTVPGRGRMMQ